MCLEKDVIVIGHDHQNTLGVVRSLGEKGYSVFLVIYSEEDVCFTSKSKYVTQAHYISHSKLVEKLLSISASYVDKKIPVVPCDDYTMKVLDSNFNLLKDKYFLPNSFEEQGYVTNLMQKANMFDMAIKAGLNVPQYIFIDVDATSNIFDDCNDFTFPCIVKPILLKDGGKFNYQIVNNFSELIDYRDFVIKNYKQVVVQQYINIVSEYGINGCRLYNSGNCVFGGVIEKIRFSQQSMGSTTAGKIVKDKNNLCDEISKFVELINFRGIFDVEFVFDGEKFYFIEINFRNGGYGYAYTKAGRNFPAIWVQEAYGKEFSELVLREIKETFFINESADLHNVKAKNQTIFRYLFDFIHAKAHMYINKNDMSPLIKKLRG